MASGSLVHVMLANPDHTFRMPNSRRLFNAKNGETVDRFDPFWSLLIADRSVVIAPAPKPADDPAAAVAHE